MKPVQLSIICLISGIIFFVSSCQKTGCTNPAASNYDPSAKKDNGKCQIKGCTDPTAHNYNSAANTNSGCIYYGKATFYFDKNWGYGSVNVGDSVGHITQIDSNSVPTCGATGCANFTLPVGTYPWVASGTLSLTQNGTITVGKDSCTVQLVTQ